MNLIDEITFILNDSVLLGKKKLKDESITTTSAGVPGDGPIADVQNGLTITQKDKEAIRKNKELIKKSLMFRRNLEEE